MLAIEVLELTRDKIVAQIRQKSERIHRDPTQVVRDYLAGNLEDFGDLAEVYALCELLDADDAIFKAA